MSRNIIHPYKRIWLHVGEMTKNGCIPWNGSITRDGYGRINEGGASRKQLMVHRVVYEHHYGKIPDQMLVCHKCDNPPCVNIEHLFLGTASDNNTDMITKGRHARGEKVNTAILSELDVLQIRELYRNTSHPQSKIGQLFGVSQCTISDIIRGKTWKHII